MSSEVPAASEPAPRVALKDPAVARLFQHYIDALAPWYDLSDARRHFTIDVPQRALNSPLLFNAIVALSAMHLSMTYSPSLRDEAERYHASCVQYLIILNRDDIDETRDVTLAAVCLLRSYEIQAEDHDPSRHLNGAYALSSSQRINFAVPSLLTAGFFNYLREDITYSLIHRCPLKIDPDILSDHENLLANKHLQTEEHRLNFVSICLGIAINTAFDEGIDKLLEAAVAARDAFEWIMENMLAQMRPYCDTSLDAPTPLHTFPEIYHLRESSVAEMQYCIVIQTLLSNVIEPDSAQQDLENNAIRLCAMAFTSGSPAIIVNSFGPISYCCRFLTSPVLQDELVRRLQGYRKQTGWPVDRMIVDLRAHWDSTRLASVPDRVHVTRHRT